MHTEGKRIYIYFSWSPDHFSKNFIIVAGMAMSSVPFQKIFSLCFLFYFLAVPWLRVSVPQPVIGSRPQQLKPRILTTRPAGNSHNVPFFPWLELVYFVGRYICSNWLRRRILWPPTPVKQPKWLFQWLRTNPIYIWIFLLNSVFEI